jgi:ferredoxin-NADP reductase
MDTNHRGGPPGFVRLFNNDTGSTTLVYPEYSGNRLYQSLGNLMNTPQIGLVFPDFETGNVLYVSGEAEVLIGKAAAKYLSHTDLAVKIRLTAARYVKKGLTFRGIQGDFSPYNPKLRYTVLEREEPVASQDVINAKLVKVDILSPTINRYRFELPRSNKAQWKPGQYVTFDFEDNLSQGYSHMRDSDPQSLNDDYIRTFTVSSRQDDKDLTTNQFEITARQHGPVTTFLARQQVRGNLEVPVKGFGGEFFFVQPDQESKIAFIAGGIGITPLIPQLMELDISRLSLFWSIDVDDVGVVENLLLSNSALAASTQLFVTGSETALSESNKTIARFMDLGAQVHKGRMTRELVENNNIHRYYICTSPTLRKVLLSWLHNKETLYEDFDY